ANRKGERSRLARRGALPFGTFAGHNKGEVVASAALQMPYEMLTVRVCEVPSDAAVPGRIALDIIERVGEDFLPGDHSLCLDPSAARDDDQCQHQRHDAGALELRG